MERKNRFARPLRMTRLCVIVMLLRIRVTHKCSGTAPPRDKVIRGGIMRSNIHCLKPTQLPCLLAVLPAH
ncbi:hypothetical protein J6590_037675 [Homalodisca vitripennis]|nr:hypothetical protein J6590_037675 [Homalodisca vitripennis]